MIPRATIGTVQWLWACVLRVVGWGCVLRVVGWGGEGGGATHRQHEANTQGTGHISLHALLCEETAAASAVLVKRKHLARTLIKNCQLGCSHQTPCDVMCRAVLCCDTHRRWPQDFPEFRWVLAESVGITLLQNSGRTIATAGSMLMPAAMHT